MQDDLRTTSSVKGDLAQRRPGTLRPALFLSVLTGVLFAFALPPRDVSILGWVALAPLLIAARRSKPLLALLCGFVAAVVCGAICGGRWNEPLQFFNLLGAFGSLALVFACAAGLGSCAARRMRPAWWPFYVACAGVAGEMAASFFYAVSVAISQYRSPAALHLASFTGIWGVSFLIWLASAGVAVLLLKPRSAVPALTVAAAVTLGIRLLPFAPQGTPITVAVIQAASSAQASNETKRITDKPAIIVWPELILRASNTRPASSARAARTYLVASIAEPNPGRRPYNSAVLYSPAGKLIGKFRKRHLIGREKWTFSRAHDAFVPARLTGFSPGMPVCFDTVFTDVTRAYVRNGADIIAVPNSDPDMPNSMLNYLHFTVIPFRAAENAVPIAWSECDGLSAIVDSDGSIVAQAPPDCTTSLTATVHLRARKTLFTIAGDYFAYMCTLFAVGAIVFSRRRRSWRYGRY